jgi:hypothetical protein
MCNFLCEAKLLWKNYLAKQLHQLLHAWLREENKGVREREL